MILKRQERQDRPDPKQVRKDRKRGQPAGQDDVCRAVLLLKNAFSFRDALESQPGKVHVIVTFHLQSLELMKTGKIRIKPGGAFRGYLIESLEDETP